MYRIERHSSNPWYQIWISAEPYPMRVYCLVHEGYTRDKIVCWNTFMENKILLLLGRTVAGESHLLVNRCCWRGTLLVTQWLASQTVSHTMVGEWHCWSHNGWRVTLLVTQWLASHTVGQTMVGDSHCWSHNGWRVTLLVTEWLVSHTVGHTMVGESHC
jgi:hypothetical protein